MSTFPQHGSRPIGVAAVLGVAAVAIIGTVIAALLFLANGGRWFVVATPSMGEAAPVGTLVLTQPTAVTSLHVGDIISFHPPIEKSATYTHRVHAIANGVVTTKGDINGAPDPWQLRDADLIGKAVAVLPGVGWLVRGLPILALGGILVLLLTRFVNSLQWRAALRIVGATLTFSIAAFTLRPFTGIQVLTTYAKDDSHAGASIVSTGLLPIRVIAEKGTSIDLVSGQVGQLSVPTLAEQDFYRIGSTLDLDVWGWALLLLACCIPLIAVLIFGLPPAELSDSDERYPVAAHDPDVIARRHLDERLFDRARDALERVR